MANEVDIKRSHMLSGLFKFINVWLTLRKSMRKKANKARRRVGRKECSGGKTNNRGR